MLINRKLTSHTVEKAGLGCKQIIPEDIGL